MSNNWYSFGMRNPKDEKPEKLQGDVAPVSDIEEDDEIYYVTDEETVIPEKINPLPREISSVTESKVTEKMVCENEVIIHETDRIINALRQSIENQQAIYGLLENQLQTSNEQLRIAKEENVRLTEIVRKQHETLSKFQNDVFYRSQKDVILEIIRIADEVEAIRNGIDNDSKIVIEMHSLVKFIDDSLVFSGVKSYREADGSSKSINLKKQEMSDLVFPTDDPEKDGNLVSIKPGYIWRLPWLVANTDVQLAKMIQENNSPKTYEVVIRPEVVGIMRYSEKDTF